MPSHYFPSWLVLSPLSSRYWVCPRAYGLIVALVLGPGLRVLAQGPDSATRPLSSRFLPASSVTALPTARRNVVKISPLVVVGQLSAFYERALPGQLTVVLGYGVGGKNRDFGRSLEDGGFTYRRGTLEVRRYWTNQGIKGFYYGPYLRVGTLRESSSVHDPLAPSGPVTWRTQQARLWTPGAMLGHQLVTRWVALDTFLGMQTTRVDGSLNRTNQFVEALTSRKLALRLGVSVGVPF